MPVNQDKLNRASPAAARVKPGDVLAELIAQVNVLTIKHNALAAKLDADAGVTDTTYVAQTGAGSVVILSLEAR